MRVLVEGREGERHRNRERKQARDRERKRGRFGKGQKQMTVEKKVGWMSRNSLSLEVKSGPDMLLKQRQPSQGCGGRHHYQV